MSNPAEAQIITKFQGELQDLLDNSKERIAAVLPHHISVDKMISVTLELVKAETDEGNKLALSTPISILEGVLEASQLGLLLMKQLGHGFLIPYKSGRLSTQATQQAKTNVDIYEAKFLIGYRGYIDLVMREGQASTVYSRIVYPGERFEIVEGTEHKIIHVPNLQGNDPDDILGAYAVVKYRDGRDPDFEWMNADEIAKIERCSKAKRDDAPWKSWREEMTKKTPIRRLCKRLKLSPETIAAVVRDEYRELVPERELPEHVEIRQPQRRSTKKSEAPAAAGGQPAEQATNGTPNGAPKENGNGAKPADAETITPAEHKDLTAAALRAGWTPMALAGQLKAKFGCNDGKQLAKKDLAAARRMVEGGTGA
jgi:recombination protein RecT